MRARVAVLVASLAAAPVSWPAAVDGSPQLRTSPSKDPGLTVPDLTSRTPGVAPAPAWDTFSADVTIRRRMVRKDGTRGPGGAGDALPLGAHARGRWVEDDDDASLSVSPDVVQTSEGSPGRLAQGAGLADRDRGCPIAGADLRRRGADALHAAHAAADRRMRTPTAGAALPAALEAVRGAAAAFKANLASAVAAGTDAGHAPADPRSRDWVEHLLPTVGGTRGPARRVRAGHGIAAGSGAGARALRPRPRRRTPPRSSAIRRGPSRVEINVVARRRPRLAQRPVATTRTLARASSAGASAASSSSRPRAAIARSSTSSSPTSASIAEACDDPAPWNRRHRAGCRDRRRPPAHWRRIRRSCSSTASSPTGRRGSMPRRASTASWRSPSTTRPSGWKALFPEQAAELQGKLPGIAGRARRRRPQQRRHRRPGVEQDQADEGAADVELAESGRAHRQQRDRLGHVQREHRRRADERPGRFSNPNEGSFWILSVIQGALAFAADTVGIGVAALGGDRVRRRTHRSSRRTRSARRTCRA